MRELATYLREHGYEVSVHDPTALAVILEGEPIEFEKHPDGFHRVDFTVDHCCGDTSQDVVAYLGDLQTRGFVALHGAS